MQLGQVIGLAIWCFLPSSAPSPDWDPAGEGGPQHLPQSGWVLWVVGCFGHQLQWMHSVRDHAAGPGMAAGLAFPCSVSQPHAHSSTVPKPLQKCS